MVFGPDIVGEMVPAGGGGLSDIVDNSNNFGELEVGAEEVASDCGAKVAGGCKDKDSFVFEGFFGIVAIVRGQELRIKLLLE